MTRPATNGSGVHNPKPNGPLQDQIHQQRAIPPARYFDLRTTICVCGQLIRDSCWGWIHVENAWVSLQGCAGAKPKSEVAV
jgi:hypothetical protein